MVRPAALDPPEITFMLWDDFGGGWYNEPKGHGWDIGVNCGQSIPIMDKLFSKYTGFEPHPDSCSFARLQYPGHDIRQQAVSYRSGTIDLALPTGEQTETGQLVTPGTPDMEWSVKDWSGVPRVSVECTTVDELARAIGLPDFIKVDTEGHEARILDGARKVLDTMQTDWLIEFHSQANSLWVQGELGDRGYRLELVRHPHYREGGRLWKAHGWIRAFAPRER